MKRGLAIRRSSIHGRGLFADRSFREGEIILSLVAPDPEYLMMNHSDEPNTEGLELQVIAIRDIEAGEELTIDYGEDKPVTGRQ